MEVGRNVYSNRGGVDVVCGDIHCMMEPKFFPVLEMCIQNGIRLGYSRAFKHNETPEEETIFMEIEKAIENEIYEWFNFKE